MMMNRIYKYFGLKFGHLRQIVDLHSARFGSDDSHIAIWAGVNDHTKWLQAGVMQMGWQQIPHVYIETGFQGKQTSFKSWPTQYKKPATVILKRMNKTSWEIILRWDGKEKKGHIFGIDDPIVDSTLEIYGKAAAVGQIGMRKVYGNTL